MTALTVAPTPTTPTGDYATRTDVWARQFMNSAAAALDAQLREIHASWREGLLELEDVTNLTGLALDTYVTAAHHPLVTGGQA